MALATRGGAGPAGAQTASIPADESSDAKRRKVESAALPTDFFDSAGGAPSITEATVSAFEPAEEDPTPAGLPAGFFDSPSTETKEPTRAEPAPAAPAPDAPAAVGLPQGFFDDPVANEQHASADDEARLAAEMELFKQEVMVGEEEASYEADAEVQNELEGVNDVEEYEKQTFSERLEALRHRRQAVEEAARQKPAAGTDDDSDDDIPEDVLERMMDWRAQKAI